ncbi:hypothetical protein NFI96_026326, partial [Prochilodus magdalenae]
TWQAEDVCAAPPANEGDGVAPETPVQPMVPETPVLSGSVSPHLTAAAQDVAATSTLVQDMTTGLPDTSHPARPASQPPGCTVERGTTTTTGSVGDTVVLPCSCEKNKPVDPQTVQWGYKKKFIGGDYTVEHSVVSKDGSVNQRYRDRVQRPTQNPPGQVSLIISPLTEEDEGTYLCGNEKYTRAIILYVGGCSMGVGQAHTLTRSPGESVLLPCPCPRSGYVKPERSHMELLKRRSLQIRQCLMIYRVLQRGKGHTCDSAVERTTKPGRSPPALPEFNGKFTKTSRRVKETSLYLISDLTVEDGKETYSCWITRTVSTGPSPSLLKCSVCSLNTVLTVCVWVYTELGSDGGGGTFCGTGSSCIKEVGDMESEWTLFKTSSVEMAKSLLTVVGAAPEEPTVGHKLKKEAYRVDDDYQNDPQNISMGPVYQSLDPKTNQSNSVYQSLNPKTKQSDSVYQSLNPKTNQSDAKLTPIDEMFLILIYLSVGLKQRDLGHRFFIHRTTVSRIIITWANFLYTLLGSVCIWMPPEVIKAHLPKEFSRYPDTQVVIDCTELRCQTPSSLLLQSEVFSTYKSHCTFKGMLGMAPHGAVTFVSALYQGSISDKEIFRQSGITSLLTPDMAIMVDKGFLVDDLVPCKIHRPAFLHKRTQMLEDDVRETQHIARLRADDDYQNDPRNISMGPVYQSLDPKTNQSDSVYQSLNPKTNQSDSVYQSLNPKTNQSDSVYQSLNPKTNQSDSVYQSLDPRTNQLDLIYQSLDPKTNQSDSVYQSLNSSTNQSDSVYQSMDPRTNQSDSVYQSLDLKTN